MNPDEGRSLAPNGVPWTSLRWWLHGDRPSHRDLRDAVTPSPLCFRLSDGGTAVVRRRSLTAGLRHPGDWKHLDAFGLVSPRETPVE